MSNTEQKPAEAAAETRPSASAAKPARRRRSILKPLIALVVLGAGSAAGYHYGREYWLDGRFLVSTDDAYVGADMTIVSPKIQGYVDAVLVTENQHVSAGEVLVRLDAGDYALALDAAEAKLATERAAIASLAAQKRAAEAQVGEAGANLDAANAQLAQSERDLDRAARLARSGAGTQAQADQAASLRQSAAAKVAGAEATLESVGANVGVIAAQIDQAGSLLRELEIARDKARRDASFAELRAPYDGTIGNLAVQPGDFVSAGKRLAAIVPDNGAYIDANFKETELGEIVPGETVRIHVDAAPDAELSGRVVSLAPASGSVFSLLPPDNATGNFTKVVQRVPVRIAVDATPGTEAFLRPGLSVTVAVDTRTRPDGEAKPDEPAPRAPSRSLDPYGGVPVASR